MTLPSLVLPQLGDSTGASEVSQAADVLRCPTVAGMRPCWGVRSRPISRRARRPHGRRGVAPPRLHRCFAGDRLLGVVAKNFDVAPDARLDTVQSLFARAIPVGLQFGVCLVVVNGQTVEVATFRADGRYLDGRRLARVRFTTAQEDALWRDFTINSMFYDPIANRIIGYVGGRADFAQRRGPCHR